LITYDFASLVLYSTDLNNKVTRQIANSEQGQLLLTLYGNKDSDE